VEIQADLVAFKEAERRFREVLQEFEASLDALEKKLERTLSEWSGDAQKAYASAHAEWNQSARDLHAELARLHKAIGRAHRNFRSAIDTNVRMWSTGIPMSPSTPEPAKCIRRLRTELAKVASVTSSTIYLNENEDDGAV
jgi:WXG100 family type VII secretion target